MRIIALSKINHGSLPTGLMIVNVVWKVCISRISASASIIISIRIRSIYPMNLSRSIHRTIENEAVGMSHDIWKCARQKSEDIIQRCFMRRECSIQIFPQYIITEEDEINIDG